MAYWTRPGSKTSASSVLCLFPPPNPFSHAAWLIAELPYHFSPLPTDSVLAEGKARSRIGPRPCG